MFDVLEVGCDLLCLFGLFWGLLDLMFLVVWLGFACVYLFALVLGGLGFWWIVWFWLF